MEITGSKDSVMLSVGGRVIGVAHNTTISVDPAIYSPQNTAHLGPMAFSGSVKLATDAMRRLAEVMNPAMKDVHHWGRVKLAQERRRLARRRQGRS